ncbi:MAG: hypothetical protein IKC23_09515 [Fibrobacter sp.]|nr:hypothetical protein [Fibrobacter sp.]
MSGKTPEIEEKINDEVIEKKALELIAEKGNPIIEDFNGFYICLGRNKFSKEKYSYHLAIIAYYSCENCIDCINCENCDGCQQCNDCKNCIDCKTSHFSESCTKCTSVWNCKECEKCVYCVDCENCKDCKDCKKCKECSNCENSENLNEKYFVTCNKIENDEENETLPTIQEILNNR